jgi:hypothetical protein
MNTPSPEPPDSGNDLQRRLNALNSPSGVSGASSAPKPSDDLPNLPAQKLLVMLARLLGHQVNADRTHTIRHEYVESELVILKERTVSKDLLLAVAGTQRDDLAKVVERVEAVAIRQEAIWDLFVKVAVVLGIVFLGLAAVVGVLMGGHHP